MRTFRSPCLATLVLCATPIPCQADARVDPTPACPAVRAIGDRVLVAEGPRYVASFAADGVTFTAAPRRRAGRELDLRLRTESFGRGDERVQADDVAPAAERAAGDASPGVRYARGGGAIERWRVRPDGIELTYTFAQPMPGDGDLVVRLALTTALVPGAATGDDAELGLRLQAPAARGTHPPRATGVRIGAVTGLDAAGRSCRGNVRLNEAMLELSLPAAFVDAAVWPIVLDPLIGPDFAPNPVGDEVRPAAAYEATSRRYLAVWQHDMNLANSQIVGQLLDVEGNPVGGTVLVRYTPGALAIEPVVASVRASGRFLVAWLEAPGFFGPWTIACRCVNPDGSLSPVLSLVTTEPEHPGPLLGSNATSADTNVLMVYGDRVDVHAQRITVPAGTGAPTLPGAVTVVTNAATGNVDVKLSKGCGTAGRWVVTWINTTQAQPAASVRARAIGIDGHLLGTELHLGPPAAGLTGYALDGDGVDFLLAELRSAGLFCRMLGWTGSDLVAQGTPVRVTGSTTGKSDVDVAFLGPKTLVTWSDDGGTPMANDIHGLALEPGTCRACDLPFGIARPGHYDFEPAVAAQYTTSPTAGDQALIVFSSAEFTPPFDSEVRAQRFEAIGAGGPFVNTGGGCGRRTSMSANGPIAIANPGLAFRVDGVAGALAVSVAVGIPTAAPLPCGSCQVAVPVVMLPAQLGGDRAEAHLGIGCEPSLVGAALELQAWVLGTAESPCPLVASLSFSDRHVATIGQ